GIYLVEAAVAYALSRRVGTLPLSVAIFWLGIGWALDILLFELVLRLDFPYVVLLFIKQLLGGVFNAAVAELLLRLPLLDRLVPRSAPESEVALTKDAFRRVCFAVLLPSAVLVFVFMRWSYRARLEIASRRLASSAERISGTLASFLREREDAL